MIPRYTRERIGAVWTQQRRMETWLQVELAATEAWAAEGVVVRPRRRRCGSKASFTVEEVRGAERTTGHDVAAFVDVVSASVGEHGRWIHYGLDPPRTCSIPLSLQLAEAGTIVLEGARAYRDALVARAKEFAETLCVGRRTASMPSPRPRAARRVLPRGCS